MAVLNNICKNVWLLKVIYEQMCVVVLNNIYIYIYIIYIKMCGCFELYTYKRVDVLNYIRTNVWFQIIYLQTCGFK